jgi:hypothetical protein
VGSRSYDVFLKLKKIYRSAIESGILVDF